MVKLIVGSKGSGKTKKLIDMANEAAKVSKGNVVCIERGDTLRYDIDFSVRLIDIKGYHVAGKDAYYGFIAGLTAGNYDITDIFGDATFKILCGKDSKDHEALAKFVLDLDTLTSDNICICLTVSCVPSELPESVRKFIA